MKAVAAAVLAVSMCARVAMADPSEVAPTPERSRVDLSYLYDGGALPFIWGALGARLLLDRYTTPRDTPLGFSSDEGGAPRAAWTVPGYAVSGLGVGLGLAMLATGDASRMYHVKGLTEALMSGVAVTGLVKVLVARHRPDWDAATSSTDSARSFPSGHATQAFAIATYGVLYLRNHVFAERRGNRVLPWWEAATYGGMLLGATAIAAERVVHNRHHLSDVIIGGVLGTATSALFYLYQERRFDRRRTREGLRSLTVAPQVTGESASVGMSFTW